MTGFVFDILFIVSMALIGYFGWKAGLTRSIFAAGAGFAAVLVAHLYPNQDGINFYLIFAITAAIIFLIGAFVFRAVHFFYMTIIDKIGGAVLGMAIWVTVAVNIIMPSIDFSMDKGKSSNYGGRLYTTIDENIEKHFPVFRQKEPINLEQSISRKIDEAAAKTKELKNFIEEKK
ncbi:MAG: hypothetical protein LBB93_01090 [Elusimicrobiota bacterium]|jgi:hypothetical protein|nr:hypothetical protein [Elusimicrobiota bacterium]